MTRQPVTFVDVIPSETLDGWLADRNPNTARAYRRSVETWHAWLFPTEPALAKRQEAAAWVAGMGRTCKPATVAARVAAVSAWHDHLVACGLARANPFADIRRPSVARYGAVQVLTVAELRRLWARLESPDCAEPGDVPAGRLRDRALISLLLNTGRRPAEIAGLRWDDLIPNPAGGWRLHTSAAAQDLPEDCHAALVDWYTAAGWPIVPAAYLWRRLRVAQCANLPTVIVDVDDHGPVTASQIGAIVRRIGRQAGLDHLTPAVLRNTFAAMYGGVQGNTGDLAKLLGYDSNAAAGRLLRSPALRASMADFSAALRALTGNG